MYDSVMSLSQWGMILQICGFFLVAVLSTLFLEKGRFGIWVGKGEALFAWITTKLESVTFNLDKTKTIFLIVGSHKERLSAINFDVFRRMLVSSMTFASWSVGTILIVAGFLTNLTWLFWTGVVLFFVTFLGFVIRTTWDKFKVKSSKIIMRVPMLLIIPFILIAQFMNWLLIPYCLLLGVLRVGQLVAETLRGKDALKDISLFIGTFILLIGSILVFADTC